MEANLGHLPTKFGHNQMQGWKVINRYRILQVNFHIWPHLTFDLLMWPLTPEYHGGQYRASTNQVWLQTDAGLESYSSFCKHHGRTDGRNLDPLVSPPPRWARQKFGRIWEQRLHNVPDGRRELKGILSRETGRGNPRKNQNVRLKWRNNTCRRREAKKEEGGDS